jgi:hypothetical protein
MLLCRLPVMADVEYGAWRVVHQVCGWHLYMGVRGVMQEEYLASRGSCHCH